MRRKSIVLKSLLCFMFGLASFILVACGAPKPTSIEVISGLPSYVRQTEQIDLSNLKLKVTYANNSTKEIGVGEVEYTFSSAELGMQDLVIKYTENKKEVSLTIQVQVISKTAIAGVEVNAFNGVYDSLDHGLTVTGTETDDTVSYSVDNGATWLDTAPVYKNAGEYTVQVKVERANFDDLIINKTISIAKKDLTIAGKTYNVTYGDAAPVYEVEYTGFVSGESSENLTAKPTITCEYSSTSDAGSYDIVIGDVEVANYNTNLIKGVVNVAKKQLTVTASSHSLTFGDEVPTYSAEITGFVNGQDKSVLTAQPNFVCEYTKTSNAGSYAVIANNAAAKNYSFNYVNGNVTVAKRTVDVVWGNLSLEYTGEKVLPTAQYADIDGNFISLNVNAGNEEGYINVNNSCSAVAVLDHKNYQLNNTTASTTFAIVKATNKWLVAPSIQDAANNSEINPTAVAKFGTPKFEYKLADETDDNYTETKPTQIGHYTLKVSVAQTENYSAIEPQTINFKIYDSRQVSVFYSTLLSARATNVNNFVEKDSILVAGSQNKFDLQIAGELNGVVDTTTEIDTEILVELFDETTQTYNRIENLDEYVTITYIQNYLQFKPVANGKTFKITVSASNPADGLNDLVYEVKVVDGYNVYEADELSVIVNAYNHDNANADNGWRAFKQERGLAGVEANAVVLQNNIVVNNENIPSYYFWSQAEVDKFTSGVKSLTNQSIVGSLKDGFGLYVYERQIAAGDNFAFYGNYFNIDYSSLSKMVLAREASYEGKVGSQYGVKFYSEDSNQNTQITTHTSLFRFAGTTKNSNLLIKDLSVFGNGRRTTDTRESGGAMLVKIEGLTSVAENNSYSNCYMGFMYTSSEEPTIEEGLTNKLINTKGYNSYNSLLYMWGVKDLLIEGGEFVGAGGPVMIVDHVDPENENQKGSYPSTINIIGTKLESFVTGHEPWFASYGADALVPQIKGADGHYNKAGATFLQEQTDLTGKTVAGMMNLKVVYKSSAAEAVNGAVVKGEVNFYNNRDEYENKSAYGLNLTTYSAAAVALNNNILQNSRTGAILGQDTTGAFAKVEDTGVTNLNFYLQNGMGIVLQLYKK